MTIARVMAFFGRPERTLNIGKEVLMAGKG